MNVAIVSVLILIGAAALAGILAQAHRARTRELREATLLALQAAAVPTLRDLLKQLPAEFTRARRYQRNITVAVLRLEIPEADPGWGPAQVLLTHAAFVAHVLNTSLRSSDLLSYDPQENRYVLTLLETDRAQARQFVQRLTQLADARGQKFRAGIAEFPSDALTLETLVERAASACAGEAREVTLAFSNAARSAAVGR